MPELCQTGLRLSQYQRGSQCAIDGSVRTGVHISNVTLGGSFFGTRISERDSSLILDRSLELGINAVDTAESYLKPDPHASETVLGRILKGRRDDVFLASKVGPSRPWETQGVNLGLTRRVVNQAVEGSLRRLQTDHIDLLFAHFPDNATPLDETLSAIDDLVRAGKIRYAGLSNHSASSVTEALWTADRLNLRPIVATQDLYNLFERVNEHDLYPTCLQHDVAAFAYAPLAGGLLSGKYSMDMVRDSAKIPAEARAGYYGKFTDDSAPTRSSPKLTERSIMAVDRVKAWAEERGHHDDQRCACLGDGSSGRHIASAGSYDHRTVGGQRAGVRPGTLGSGSGGGRRIVAKGGPEHRLADVVAEYARLRPPLSHGRARLE